MNLRQGEYSFLNLGTINIILGKNGSGKSTALKQIIDAVDDQKNSFFIEYITPERGGYLQYQANIENNMQSNPAWFSDSRKKNQFEQFKQQTISRYQTFELKVLRKIAGEKRSDFTFSFEKFIDKINSLLDNIEIKSGGEEKNFKIRKKGIDQKINPENISSGESELIALAIECLHFQQSDSAGKMKILLLDEPDVHLHPDLQVKFMRFIHDLATEDNLGFKVIIATHSTALLGAIENKKDINIGFISPGQKETIFKPVTEIFAKFLPIFGAHPLSTIFNEAPILLVEGDDDERIWQQAVRSSAGKIKLHPCVCGDVVQITAFENEIKEVISSVYDNPKAYSLRDRDNSNEDDLPDDGSIIKLKLKCYSAENLLLTDEVLAAIGFTWNQAKTSMDEWIMEKSTKTHPQLNEMLSFQASDYNRKETKVKFLRNLILGILGSAKPWEVVIGQTIAGLRWDTSTNFITEGSIYNYLGEKIVKKLLIHS